jgi:hypothetical protein
MHAARSTSRPRRFRHGHWFFPVLLLVFSFEDAAAHPIYFLLFLLGLIHAVEATLKVTLSLLHDVRRTVARIVASGHKHERELRTIARTLTRRERRRRESAQARPLKTRRAAKARSGGTDGATRDLRRDRLEG